MNVAEAWRVLSFSRERAGGRLRQDATGRERDFTVDDWVPCARELLAQLRPGEEFPRSGELVQVLLGSTGRAQISPLQPRTLVPLRRFLDWFEALKAHLPALRDWDTGVWEQICAEAEEDLSDTVGATDPGRPEEHLGLLVWLAAHGPPLARARLGWLAPVPTPGQPLAAIVGEADAAGLALEDDLVEALLAQSLVLRPATAWGPPAGST